MSKLSLVVRLLCAGVIVSAVSAPELAYAQPAPVFEAGGMIDMVPASGVVGDGATVADLYVLALDTNGAPISGLALKATVSTGAVGALTDAGGGLYRLAYTPPKVDAKVTATLTLKGKIGKESVSKTFNFNVAPARSRQLSAAANPPRMTLGQDRTATLSFQLSGGDRQGASGVDLILSASSGTVENVTNLGGGQYTALYTAPAVNYPQVAIVTVADRRDPSGTLGALAIPLSGKVEFPVTSAPNARVIIKIGEQQFGPIQADAQGRARVPILVPPGATVAEKISIGADGKSVSEPLDLKVPEARRISMVPTAAALPSDGRLQVNVYAAVVTPDGKPDTSAAVVFTTTAGVVGPAKHVGNGIYGAAYTPPNGASAGQATLTASLSDKPAVQTASQVLNLVSVRPASVVLTAEPATLSSSADGFKLFAKVTGPDGVGLGARTITFGASGARIKGEVKDLRNGDYQALFSTTGNGPVELNATVASPVTGNPLSRMVIIPSKSRITNDGLSSSMLTIATLDEFGYPVPGVPVSMRILSGDGTLPASSTSNADGLAQVFYTAGRKAGLVTYEVTAADLIASGSLLQVPATLALPTLPVAGSRADAGLVAEWDKALSEIRIEREGMTGAVLQAPTAVLAGGSRVARAAVMSDPATVSPGGSVKVRINLSDEEGRGVGGQQLEFLTSAGTVSSVTELGGGQYEAVLTVPSNAAGDVKVSVATRDGSASSFMRVPVGGAADAWSNANPFATTPVVDPYAAQPAQPVAVAAPPPVAPQPVSPVAPVVSPTPVAPVAPVTTTTTTTKMVSSSDRPWLRVRGGYELAYYSYNQLPASRTTVLYPKEIAVASWSNGAHLQGRAFLPGFRYLGAEVDFRATSYAIDPVPLCAALDNECATATLVSDWVLATHAVAIPRYYFEAGANEFHVGARLGWANSDVQTYTVKGGQEIQLDQLALNSLSLGADLGAEIGDSLFFVAHIDQHLAGATTPFNTEFTFEVGYAFLPNLYASLGYDMSMRTISIENRDGAAVGNISDSLHGLSASVGVQF